MLGILSNIRGVPMEWRGLGERIVRHLVRLNVSTATAIGEEEGKKGREWDQRLEARRPVSKWQTKGGHAGRLRTSSQIPAGSNKDWS